MIAFLRGKLAWSGTDQAVIDVGGVGYRVYTPSSTRARLPEAGREAKIYTYLHVREDALTLYGFTSEDEYQLFELLLGVSGVGPKVALGILSGVTPEGFRRAVVFEDLATLTNIPGVGKKTAQRLILELKDKVGAIGPVPTEMIAATSPGLQGDAWSEALEALVSLGYSRVEAGQALEKNKGAAGTDPLPEQLVRLGLKALAGR